MNAETHAQLASFIWTICNLLRGPYKRNEYRKVILPLTVLRRFDCLLAPTKARVLAEHARIKGKPDAVVRSLLQKITGRPFYNLSPLEFSLEGKHSLLHDANNDYCDAWLTEDYALSLQALKDAYAVQYGGASGTLRVEVDALGADYVF